MPIYKVSTPEGESPTALQVATGKWVTVPTGQTMALELTEEQARILTRWLGPELVTLAEAPPAGEAPAKPKQPSKPKAKQEDASGDGSGSQG